MRFARLLLATSMLLPATALWGQQVEITTDPGMFARLAYDTTAAMQRGEVRHVCLAITLDGEYRIIRSSVDKDTEYLRGQMSNEDLVKLKGLLTSKQFHSQSGNLGGLIRQDSESFRAELPTPLKKRADGTYIMPPPEPWRLEWLNADDGAPFPASISKVVNWLQSFQPKNAKEFSYTEFSDVCPSGGLRFVQPAVATNERP